MKLSKKCPVWDTGMKGIQLNTGSHTQNADVPPHPISRQVGNVAIKINQCSLCSRVFFSRHFPNKDIFYEEQEWNLYGFRWVNKLGQNLRVRLNKGYFFRGYPNIWKGMYTGNSSFFVGVECPLFPWSGCLSRIMGRMQVN